MARRSAIVTGGGTGIGLAIARLLAEEGFDLTLVGRNADRLGVAAEQLRSEVAVQAVSADLAEADAASTVVEYHLSQFQTLDILVASAGQTKRAGVADTRPSMLRRLLAVNVEATFSLVTAALPALRRNEEERPSWVFILSSMAAHWPVDSFAAYSATKAAVASLARSITAEEGSRGVRACALCPGFVDTELSAPLAAVVDPSSMISPDDIAQAVRFMLSLSDSATVTELTISRRRVGPLLP